MKINKNLILSLLVGSTIYFLLEYEKLTDQALETLNDWAEQQVTIKELQTALNQLKEQSPIKEEKK